jgi:hypothetical protein
MAIKQILQELIQDEGTFNEGFSDNLGVRQGDSFEGFLTDKFISGGFPNFTDENLDLRKSKKLDYELFGQFDTQKAKNEYAKWIRNNLEHNTKEVINTLNLPQGFIEQPLSSKRQPDIFIWWTNEDGNKDWLLIDVKTGGGRSPKLNDREIGWHHVVIFNSRHKTVAHRPTTITFAKDLFPQHEYDGVERARLKAKNMRQELLNDQKDHEYIVYDFRDRVQIKNKASNWFEPIRNITREQREQSVLDSL